jgi:hypothetical protein
MTKSLAGNNLLGLDQSVNWYRTNCGGSGKQNKLATTVVIIQGLDHSFGRFWQ